MIVAPILFSTSFKIPLWSLIILFTIGSPKPVPLLFVVKYGLSKSSKFLLLDVIEMEVRGRNLAEGIPITFTMNSKQAYDAMLEPLSSIIQAIRTALEASPPELSADISERGIVLTGGGAMLRDLDVLISSQTGLPVIVAEDPLTCVAKGGGSALEIMDKYDIDLLSTE